MCFADLRTFVLLDDDALPIGYRDEFLKADWTLVQTLAWAIHRSPAWARRFGQTYLSQKPREPLPLVDVSEAWRLLIHQQWPGETVAPKNAFEEPLDAMWDALEAGRLKARGKPADSNDRVEIPASFWQDVNRAGGHGGAKDAVAVLGATDEGGIRYEEVRVRREEVLTIWPEKDSREAVVLVVKKVSAKAERRRGPKPIIGPRVEKAMRADLESRKFTKIALSEMTFDALGAEYRASPTTASEARDRVLE